MQGERKVQGKAGEDSMRILGTRYLAFTTCTVQGKARGIAVQGNARNAGGEKAGVQGNG